MSGVFKGAGIEAAMIGIMIMIIEAEVVQKVVPPETRDETSPNSSHATLIS